jgi:hypothetical protein
MIGSVEFYVRDVVKSGGGERVVVGIPNNRVPLKVGDIFKTRYEVAREEIMSGAPNPKRLNVANVELVVEKIEVYRKPVDTLPHGMTGGLYLSGTGLAAVVPHCFLRTQED